MPLPLANIDHTLFFVLGITLVASAVLVAIAGLRFEDFPPNRLVLLAVAAWFVGLVGGTTTFAVLNARDEQHKKEAEQAAAESTSTSTSTTPTSTTSTGTTPTTAAGNPAEGKALFASQGCSSCHTLKAAGATGTIGPDLDKYLKGKPASFIKTSIVNPNAYVEKGFPANTMPANFGSTLQPSQIDSLVAFLVASTSGK